MTDRPDPDSDPSGDPLTPEEGIEISEDEMGEPLSQLAMVEHPPSGGFFARVRDRIENRRLGAHVASFAVSAPLLIFASLFEILTGFVAAASGTRSPPPADGEGGD